MSEPRQENRSAAAPILIAVLLLGFPLGAYVAGYIWLGEREVVYGSPSFHPRLRRTYPRWFAVLCEPARRIEQQWRDLPIEVVPD